MAQLWPVTAGRGRPWPTPATTMPRPATAKTRPRMYNPLYTAGVVRNKKNGTLEPFFRNTFALTSTSEAERCRGYTYERQQSQFGFEFD